MTLLGDHSPDDRRRAAHQSHPMKRLPLAVLGLASLLHAGEATRRFDFGDRAATPGSIVVKSSDLYDPAKGYGFEPGRPITSPAQGGFVTGQGGFYFSAELPEGNYEVAVKLGDPKGDSDTTIKAECRRLMLEDIKTPNGKQVVKKFVVNVRRPEIIGGDRVRLKAREIPYLHWDHKLTLEFNGPRPAIAGIEIKAVEVPTVYLMGDSTVTDQPYEPWNSWGQMVTRFFKPDLAIANYAESGESIKSSLSANRFKKAYAGLKKGDWMLVQFGHNDMKEKSPDALETYRKNLEEIVKTVRDKQATPILVTSMERKGGVKTDTLGGYPDAVRDVAKRLNVQLIDLHAMSRELYVGLGGELDKAFQDGTHHNNFGSYEIAKCVVEGIRKNAPELAAHLAEDAGKFDPSHPDKPADFHVALSPASDAAKPDGN